MFIGGREGAVFMLPYYSGGGIGLGRLLGKEGLWMTQHVLSHQHQRGKVMESRR
jgi:hypothetical protein